MPIIVLPALFGLGSGAVLRCGLTSCSRQNRTCWVPTRGWIPRDVDVGDEFLALDPVFARVGDHGAEGGGLLVGVLRRLAVVRIWHALYRTTKGSKFRCFLGAVCKSCFSLSEKPAPRLIFTVADLAVAMRRQLE